MSDAEIEKGAQGKPQSAAEQRKNRLAQALRQNLRLRKARARAEFANADAAETITADLPDKEETGG